MVVSNERTAVVPRIVGRYALFDEIAAGGMATIHLGRLVGPVGFARTVAIKSLHPQFAKDPEFVESFLDEARLASRIQHPNVVSTVDVVTTEGEVFLVMEYVAGESLAKLVRSALKKGQQIPAPVALNVLTGMLHGLHATHEAKNERREPMNIVHRDVSPQNVLVGLDGITRVLDFGVAKAAMRAQATRDGQMKGKLSYMSPEQLNSREVDRRTDVFAAGIVAWECLVGRRLFAGSDPGEVLAKVLTLDIPSPRDVSTEVTPLISEAVMRALERDPNKRWPTARDFAISLEQNGTLAAGHRVGEWVEEHATEALHERQRRVTAVERATIDLALDPATQTISERVHTRPVVVSAQLRVENAEPVDFSNAGSGTTQAANLTVTSQSPALQQPAGTHGWLVLAFSAILLLTAGGVWLYSRRAPERSEALRPGAPLPELGIGMEPPAGALPYGATSSGARAAPGSGDPSASGSAGKPLTTPASEALRALGAPEDAGAASQGLPSQGLEAPSASTPAAQPEKHDPALRDRRVQRGPAKASARVKPRPKPAPLPPPPPPPPPPAPAKVTPPKGAAPPEGKSAECTPPYSVDSSGIRRLKPECL